jgi:hypothetical protein
MGITVKIQRYSLAVLPIEYLTRQDALRERMRVDAGALNPYRDVFIAGARAHRQHAYLELVRWTDGRNVAQQIKVYQQRLLAFSTGSGRCIAQALDRIEGALHTRAVRADSREGEIEMPIEMNVTLALLLGTPELPDYAATARSRTEQIVRMQPEIDCCLAHCLACAREEMKNTFLPVVAHVEGTAGSEVTAGCSA